MKMFTLLICVLAPFFAFSQPDMQAKFFVKTVPLKAAHTVNLNVDGAVKVLQWEKPYVRLHVNVEAVHKYPNLIKDMTLAGRYRIQSVEKGSTLVLDVPRVKTPILYNDLPVNEVIWYTLYIPSYVEVDSPSILTFNTDASLEMHLSY